MFIWLPAVTIYLVCNANDLFKVIVDLATNHILNYNKIEKYLLRRKANYLS